MPYAAVDARDNLLVASLPQEQRERLRRWLQPVELEAGQVLHEAWQPPRHVYFPLGAVVSLQVQSEDGRCDEVAIVAREGMVGVAAFTGSGWVTMRSVVSGAGRALRVSAERIRNEFEGSGEVSRWLLQYLATQDAQVAQGVVCSRHHSIEQRLCLRLLRGMDCQQDSRLEMTHEQLSGWLGVRRVSVTEEALKLQNRGLIAYARGRITVLDRSGLEQRSCECYSLLTSGYRRPGAGATMLRPLGREGASHPLRRSACG